MNSEIISPFRGLPETRLLTVDGKPAYLVVSRELTPERFTALQTLTGIGGLAILLFMLASAASAPQPTGGTFLTALIVAGVLVFLLHRALDRLLRERVPILLTAESVRVRGKKYRLKPDEGFRAVPHEHAKKEAMDEQFRMRKAQAAGKVVREKTTYRDSAHILARTMEEGYVLVLTVHGEKPTLAVQTRLNDCRELLKGMPTQPAEQWADQPGEIPE
jgi:hypothetical protein